MSSKSNKKFQYLKYLNEKKKYYDDLNYKTPILDYLINNEQLINDEFLLYNKEEDSKIDHLYKL